MPENFPPAVPAEGLRERKRRETRQRIAETGLRLFLARGYEGTTLDAIAEEAGISRRTFFSYFKSKDDVLFAWQAAGWDGVHADLLKVSPDVRPVDALCDVIAAHSLRHTAEETARIDKLLRSSETFMARKQTFYLEQENRIFATFCEVWRQPERRPALRVLAMACMGAVRLTIQAWNEQVDQPRPFGDLLRDTFARLKSEL